MVLNPFVVDRDVAFKKVKARIVHERTDAIVLHVHAPDLPIGVGEYGAAEVVTDKAVDTKDQDLLHALVALTEARVSGRAGTGSHPKIVAN